MCYFNEWWNFASSAGEPKQKIDCIDFIHETVALSLADESFIFFYLQKGKKNILGQHIYILATLNLNDY